LGREGLGVKIDDGEWNIAVGSEDGEEKVGRKEGWDELLRFICEGCGLDSWSTLGVGDGAMDRFSEAHTLHC
jgi:hypothetical protein